MIEGKRIQQAGAPTSVSSQHRMLEHPAASGQQCSWCRLGPAWIPICNREI